MEDTKAFAPLYRPSSGTGTGTLVASTTVAASTTHAASAQFAGNYDQNSAPQVLITNTTSAWAYVNFGQYGNVTAATVAASLPVPPGGQAVVTVTPEVSGADVILASGSGNVIFTRGSGVLSGVGSGAGSGSGGSAAAGALTGSTVTRPADTTAYASGDLVANSTTAGSVTPISFTLAAGTYDILDASLLTLSTVLTNASFRLHLYTSSPTVTNGDNGAWLSPKAGYVGAFDITCDRAFSDGAFGRGLSLTQTPQRITSTGTLYGLIEARAAYTPTSAGTFIPTLTVG